MGGEQGWYDHTIESINPTSQYIVVWVHGVYGNVHL